MIVRIALIVVVIAASLQDVVKAKAIRNEAQPKTTVDQKVVTSSSQGGNSSKNGNGTQEFVGKAAHGFRFPFLQFGNTNTKTKKGKQMKQQQQYQTVTASKSKQKLGKNRFVEPKGQQNSRTPNERFNVEKFMDSDLVNQNSNQNKVRKNTQQSGYNDFIEGNMNYQSQVSAGAPSMMIIQLPNNVKNINIIEIRRTTRRFFGNYDYNFVTTPFPPIFSDTSTDAAAEDTSPAEETTVDPAATDAGADTADPDAAATDPPV